MAPLRPFPRVFVVDDEWIIASTTAAILRLHGFDAKAFDSPHEAFRAACDENPDILLADVLMPRLSGVKLGILMKMVCPDCEVLLFSGHSNVAHMLASGDADGHGFELLSKPVQPLELIARVRHLALCAA